MKLGIIGGAAGTKVWGKMLVGIVCMYLDPEDLIIEGIVSYV